MCIPGQKQLYDNMRADCECVIARGLKYMYIRGKDYAT